MLLALLGTAFIGVSAAEVEYVELDLADGNISIKSYGFDIGDDSYDYTGGKYLIKYTGGGVNRIDVQEATCTIILDNVDMSANQQMITIGKASDVTLVLRGTNKVKFSDTAKTGSAIGVAGDAKLTIEAESATDSLEVVGGAYGAGIGSTQDSYATTAQIIINSGKITATCGNTSASESAAIGGARNSGAQVTINGGDITATGLRNGPGIGAGREAPEGTTVTINGGLVKAVGGVNSAGIGGGYKSAADIYVNGGVVTATSGHASKVMGVQVGGVDFENVTSYTKTPRVYVTGGSILSYYKGDTAAPNALTVYKNAESTENALVQTAVALPSATDYIYVGSTPYLLAGTHIEFTNLYYFFFEAGSTPKLAYGDKEVTVTPGTAVTASDWTTAQTPVSKPAVNTPAPDTIVTIKPSEITTVGTTSGTTASFTAPTTSATTTAAPAAEETTTAATTTAAEEEGGCGSAIGVSGIALVASAAALGAIVKKRKED